MLHLALLQRKGTMSSGPPWVLEAAHSSFGCVTPAHLLSDLNAASFEWVPEQEKVLQQVQAAVPAALPLGLYDPADPLVLEVAVADRKALWSLWQAPVGESGP